jgi:hypothetical protein
MAVMVRRSRNVTVADLGCHQLQLPGKALPACRPGAEAEHGGAEGSYWAVSTSWGRLAAASRELM